MILFECLRQRDKDRFLPAKTGERTGPHLVARMRPGLVPLAVVLTANVASLLPVEGIAAGPSEPGRQIYDPHCASCHGQKLEGQPNWRIRLPTGRLPAPPHDAGGHTWHHTDDELFR